ncbi:hypothetical protein RHGRI_023938 [Rhododendron griersonianum]|uniref:Uncharacterized protein n=1 Tax=Rhododendron griersonianum TaxID=479676 RepID=A0AAV6J7D2_9ERIC|nr:hypothetical protein RHGRI_023938 [Rhododendron griersonianum]
MKLSSVSPLRWLTITPHPAAFESRAARIDSVTVPIWYKCLPSRVNHCKPSSEWLQLFLLDLSPTSHHLQAGYQLKTVAKSMNSNHPGQRDLQ